MSDYAQILVIIANYPSLMFFLLFLSLVVLIFLGGAIYLISNSYLKSKVDAYIDKRLGQEWEKSLEQKIQTALDEKIDKEISQKFEAEKEIIYRVIDEKKSELLHKNKEILLVNFERFEKLYEIEDLLKTEEFKHYQKITLQDAIEKDLKNYYVVVCVDNQIENDKEQLKQLSTKAMQKTIIYRDSVFGAIGSEYFEYLPQNRVFANFPQRIIDNLLS